MTPRERTALVLQAEKLEKDADLLYYSLLANSMRERTMRDEARKIRQRIEAKLAAR